MNIVFFQGEYLKKLREERGMSQEALAEKSNLSRTQIQRFEKNASKNPGLKTVSNLAEALGVSIEELIFEREEKNR